LPEAGADLTVSDVVLAYDKWAENDYHREGKENTHLGMIRDALRVVRNLFGRTPAAEPGGFAEGLEQQAGAEQAGRPGRAEAALLAAAAQQPPAQRAPRRAAPTAPPARARTCGGCLPW
jgi:hypothetical protein